MNKWMTAFGAAALLLNTGLAQQAFSQEPQEDSPFEAKTFENESGAKLDYRMLSPKEVKDGDKYPLVIFLHGAGERGDDNTAQLVHVVGELATEEMRDRYPTFVIAPQCPKGHTWATIPRWGRDIQEHVGDVAELAKSLCEENPIDENRIYVMGLSMGGFGTWKLLYTHPNEIAAAIPICGGGEPEKAGEMVNVPIWVFHGDADPAVNVQMSRDMIAAIEKAGGHPIYTEYPGVGHDCWTQTAENRLVWDWLFAQTRAGRSDEDHAHDHAHSEVSEGPAHAEEHADEHDE